MCTVDFTHSGTSTRAISPPASFLEDELGLEALEVGQEQDVGLVAGRERAELREAVAEAGLSVAMTSASSGATPWATASRTIELTCPSSAMCSGLAVVGAEGEPVRPELLDERQERGEVARGRGLPDQHPHAGAQALAALLGRVALVVGADGGRVGLQVLAEDARRVPVDVRGAEGELSSSCRSPAMTPGKFIISASPITRRRRSSPRGRPGSGAARRLERRRGHAGRGHEEDVERHLRAQVGEPVDAVRAEDVRDLVRVGDDGGRAEREDEARELVHEELRGLQVHVRVDEPGTTCLPPAWMTSRPAYSPRPATKPSQMATSVSSHSRVKTEKTCPPWMTTSASSSPRATARRRARSGTREPYRGADDGRARGELH